MQDGYVLKRNLIHYDESDWVIGEVLFVPGNPQLYVELKKGGITMNVTLNQIGHLITEKPKFTDIYEYDII